MRRGPIKDQTAHPQRLSLAFVETTSRATRAVPKISARSWRADACSALCTAEFRYAKLMHRIRRAYRTNQGHDYLLRAVDCLGSSTETRRNHVGKCATLSDTSCSSCTTRPNPKGLPELEHCSNSTQLIASRTVRAGVSTSSETPTNPKGSPWRRDGDSNPEGVAALPLFESGSLPFGHPSNGEC